MRKTVRACVVAHRLRISCRVFGRLRTPPRRRPGDRPVPVRGIEAPRPDDDRRPRSLRRASRTRPCRQALSLGWHARPARASSPHRVPCASRGRLHSCTPVSARALCGQLWLSRRRALGDGRHGRGHDPPARGRRVRTRLAFLSGTWLGRGWCSDALSAGGNYASPLESGAPTAPRWAIRLAILTQEPGAPARSLAVRTEPPTPRLGALASLCSMEE